MNPSPYIFPETALGGPPPPDDAATESLKSHYPEPDFPEVQLEDDVGTLLEDEPTLWSRYPFSLSVLSHQNPLRLYEQIMDIGEDAYLSICSHPPSTTSTLSKGLNGIFYPLNRSKDVGKNSYNVSSNASVLTPI